MDLTTLATVLADKEAYDSAGGAGGGLIAVVVILWLLFGTGGKK